MGGTGEELMESAAGRGQARWRVDDVLGEDAPAKEPKFRLEVDVQMTWDLAPEVPGHDDSADDLEVKCDGNGVTPTQSASSVPWWKNLPSGKRFVDIAITPQLFIEGLRMTDQVEIGYKVNGMETTMMGDMEMAVTYKNGQMSVKKGGSDTVKEEEVLEQKVGKEDEEEGEEEGVEEGGVGKMEEEEESEGGVEISLSPDDEDDEIFMSDSDDDDVKPIGDSDANASPLAFKLPPSPVEAPTAPPPATKWEEVKEEGEIDEDEDDDDFNKDGTPRCSDCELRTAIRIESIAREKHMTVLESSFANLQIFPCAKHT